MPVISVIGLNGSTSGNITFAYSGRHQDRKGKNNITVNKLHLNTARRNDQHTIVVPNYADSPISINFISSTCLSTPVIC